MKYKILQSYDAYSGGSFEDHIEDHLSRGWRLQGGVSANGEDDYYHQALVLPDDQTDPGPSANFGEIWRIEDPKEIAGLLRHEIDRREHLKNVTAETVRHFAVEVGRIAIEVFAELSSTVPEASLAPERVGLSMNWSGERVAEVLFRASSIKFRTVPDSLLNREFMLELRTLPADWVWLDADPMRKGQKLSSVELARHLIVLFLRHIASKIREQ